MFDLGGKTAVITGAASGIGRALAHRFGAAGMNLVLGDIEQKALDRVEAELVDAGYPVAAMTLDVRDLDAIVAFEALARDRFANVHLLCNNAGVGAGGSVADFDNLELWKWTIDINLWGVIYGCKVFLPNMIGHGEQAHVVNTASLAGHLSAPFMGAYNVSKYGVVALSETLAQEMLMSESEVGVSVLCPAFVATQIASSERNLPDDIASAQRSSNPHSSMPAEGAKMIEDLVASGMPSEQVAEAVHEAVLENRFWILTHPESSAGITARATQIVEGINPSPAFHG